MSSSMQSQMSSPLSDSNLVLDAALSNALNDYMAITGQELLEHPLSAEAQQSDSVDSILAIFQGQVEALRQFRAGNQILMNWISPVVNILFKFSEMLGGVATVVGPAQEDPRCILRLLLQAFPPAGAIFSGISILLAVSIVRRRSLWAPPDTFTT
jgi:hypothetical protein